MNMNHKVEPLRLRQLVYDTWDRPRDGKSEGIETTTGSARTKRLRKKTSSAGSESGTRRELPPPLPLFSAEEPDEGYSRSDSNLPPKT